MRNTCSLCLFLLSLYTLLESSQSWNHEDDSELAQTDDHAGLLSKHLRNTGEAIDDKRGKNVKRKGGEHIENGGRKKLPKNKQNTKGRQKNGNKNKAKVPLKKENQVHEERLLTGGNLNHAGKETICTINSDCSPGHCCTARKKGPKVCRPFVTLNGKKCLDSCACAEGMECFVGKMMADQNKKKSKKPRKIKGICKIPDSSDLIKGSYLKAL